MDLHKKSVHELHDMLVRKEIKAAELTTAYLKHIEKAQPKVNAYITVLAEQAMDKAAAVDAKIAQGAKIDFLTGIPGAIKDNICTMGVKTTCSSKILDNFVPPYDATVVEKLHAADTVVLGKTNLDEFAMGGSTETSAYGTTHNPWNLAYVPGGSSGGSAAAVASSMAAWALGSDTGGSIRQPAAYCGVVGLKPTYGRVSRYGLVAYASSLDQIGSIARNVTDCAYILGTIAGYDCKDSTSVNQAVPDYGAALVKDVKGMKIGLPAEYFVDGMDDEVRQAIEKAVADYKAMGAEIVEISLPNTKYATATYYLIACAEAATNLSRYDGVSYGERVNGDDIVSMMTNTRTEKFGTEVKRRIMIGNYALSEGYYDAYYLKALKVRRLIKEDYDAAFTKVDAILAPIAPTPAYKIGSIISDPLKMYLQDVCTVPLNLAGLPAISLRCGTSSDGLPIGMQLIGKTFDEATIIRAAYTYEQSKAFYKEVAEVTEQ